MIPLQIADHECVILSLHSQRLEIRSVPAPPGQHDQPRAPPQLEEKTIRELNQMDPYEFSASNIHVRPLPILPFVL